jgi:hypothetical protein
MKVKQGENILDETQSRLAVLGISHQESPPSDYWLLGRRP